MAGLIIVCPRHDTSPRLSGNGLEALAVRLSPDDIDPSAPWVAEHAGVLRAVLNPAAGGVRTDDHGVCLGALFGDADWSEPRAPSPDGSYVIARHDERVVELVTDAFASRTIWYVLSDDCFFASTSQRALAALLGDFRPNPETVAWMVASGYLGPEIGWDERVRRVPPGTCLRLDRAEWRLTSTFQRVEYRPVAGSLDEHVSRLREAVFTACRDLDLDGDRWVLPISGGHDSRALLVGLLEAGRTPTCITWGLARSLEQPGNDAYIGRQLADRFGLEHRYFELDPTGEPMRDVLTRFLLAGEGRAIDFSGYTDGMRTWKQLHDDGVTLVLRGDTPGLGSGQGRAYDPVNEFSVRTSIGRAVLATDYPDGHIVRRLGLAPQHLPARLRLQPDESLGMYRDRIHNEYKVATMFASLNDPKCAYVEVVNPLLHRAVVKAVSQLPDELRLWERGYATMVEALVPDVPMDQHHAEAQPDEYLAWPAMIDEIVAELSSRPEQDVLPSDARELLVTELSRAPGRESTKRRLRRRVKNVLPSRALRLIPPRMGASTREIAFRAYIASRMASILREDARGGAAWHGEESNV